MGLIDRLRKRTLVPDHAATPMRSFLVSFDDDGANFTTTSADFALLRAGKGQRSTQEQHIVLSMLEEQGDAYAIRNGYSMRSFDVTRLDNDERGILRLPQPFRGTFTAEVRGNTTSTRFEISLKVKTDGRTVAVQRHGPIIEVGASKYLLSSAALKVIRAVERHSALPANERTDHDNVRLVAELKAAQAAAQPSDGVAFSLGHLDHHTTTTPASVALLVSPGPDGSLTLAPDLGPDVDPGLLANRLQQLDHQDNRGVIRLEDQFVLLEERQLRGVQEIRAKSRISAKDRSDFLTNPAAFLDATLVDIDIHFGVRVEGVGIIVPQTFAEASESGISWFTDSDSVHPASVLAGLISSLPALDKAEIDARQAREEGRSTIAVEDHLVDISDEHQVMAALEQARQRLSFATEHDQGIGPTPDSGSEEHSVQVVQVGVHVAEAESLTEALQQASQPPTAPSFIRYDGLLRQPYPHQIDGVRWMVEMISSATGARESDPTRVQGALLADDMGLGKTYMTLVALSEFMADQSRAGGSPRPCLAVLPVSLIENWEGEVAATFPTNPFRDVVVLQTNRDLKRFRLDGAGRETKASAARLDARGMLAIEDIRLSLRVGETYGDARLDQPGRLVLATYETLADYQLSLSQVDWGVVVFDEAQNLKNPDTLRSRAARALKAQFKLVATGTPVENSMRDFWSLLDTAQPGLLGTWSQFRTEWVSRLSGAAPGEREQAGLDLRELVGRYMLRRVKEDHLANLPSKTVYSPFGGKDQAARPDLGQLMPSIQRDAYDGVLNDYRQAGVGTKGAALRTIAALRAVSLHPGAASESSIAPDSADALQSARIIATLRVLDEIHTKGEKAILFVISKKVQVRLATWISDRYRIPVRVVNGDTVAVSRGASETRRSIIADFEAASGFNAIIMSPLAVGVGLTVVGANHAIHLERHWNPAKEAQATDRIYRIGQTREVHVYLPMALHPDMESFDLNLDRLLQGKTTLRNAVVVPEEVSEAEMVASMGL